MTDQPMSRRRAKVQAVTLACLLMAAAPPVVAQETAPAEPATPAQTETPAPAAPGTEATDTTAPTAPAPSAPAAAPDTETAPATVPDTGTDVTGAAPAESLAPAPTSEPAAAVSPATSPATGTPTIGTPASDAAPVQDAPAAGEATAQDAPEQTAVSDAVSSDPAAPAATAPATDTPATSTPATDTAAPDVAASQPVAEVEEPSDSLLPDSIQRMFTPVERDPNLPHDLSPMGMFLAADWVVKAVMIGLAFASVVTWTVLLVKLIELWQAGNRAARTLRRVEGASDLAAAAAITDGRRDPGSRMVLAAMRELERSRPALGAEHGQNGLKERVASHLDQIEAAAGRKIGRGTGLLATIGSTAPFVGLFGTVWGIMNSFIGISEAQTTNLAVVAPGIAEALLATALGLVAAIPAVIIYNHFARTITGYRLRLGSVGAAVQRVLSRDLDFKAGA